MYFKSDAKEGMSQRNLMKKYNLSRAEVRYYINKLAPKEKKDLKQVIKEMRK
jgi:Mor family transcriptional regulator